MKITLTILITVCLRRFSILKLYDFLKSASSHYYLKDKIWKDVFVVWKEVNLVILSTNILAILYACHYGCYLAFYVVQMIGIALFFYFVFEILCSVCMIALQE